MLFSIMSTLQTQHHFKLDFQKPKLTNIEDASGLSTSPITTRIITNKVWSTLVENLKMA